MVPPEPFTFGIALIARATARDWRLTQALLDLTLASIFSQSDQDFRVVIAGHDRPLTCMDADPRLDFFAVGWPAEDPGPHNVDSGGCRAPARLRRLPASQARFRVFWNLCRAPRLSGGIAGTAGQRRAPGAGAVTTRGTCKNE